MGTFQVYFPWPPSGLFGPGNCTLQVIWDGHNTPGYFSGPPSGLFGLGNSSSTLRVIWAVHAPSGLYGTIRGATLRVIWAWQFYFYPPGYLGCTPSGLYGTLRVIWAGHPLTLLTKMAYARIILGSGASASQYNRTLPASI